MRTQMVILAAVLGLLTGCTITLCEGIDTEFGGENWDCDIDVDEKVNEGDLQCRRRF